MLLVGMMHVTFTAHQVYNRPAVKQKGRKSGLFVILGRLSPYFCINSNRKITPILTPLFRDDDLETAWENH